MTLPPDPSLPNAQQQQIRETAIEVLSDPLALPDDFVSWLQEVVQLYANMGTAPTATSTSSSTTTKK